MQLIVDQPAGDDPVITDLVFPVSGTSVPADHAYLLYSALSRLVPQFHEEGALLRFAPITGTTSHDGQLDLGPHSCMRVRLSQDAIKVALPLAGRRLEIGESSVRLGVPAIRALQAAPMLIARIVTFKNADTPEQFQQTARAKLQEVGVTGEPQLPIHLHGEHAGEPKRRVIRIKGVIITGYSLIVAELSATDSIKLQETGLGGRTHIGCGFFTPAKTRL